MKAKLRLFFLSPVTVTTVYVIMAVIVSVLQYFAGDKAFDGIPYTHYNNYIIFKQSLTHLLNNGNLYQAWPHEHWDFYKYSPTFPVLFSPFLLLPDWAGLIVWNLLNAILLFYAIININGISTQSKLLMLWFVLPELVVSLQNSQSNGLMAALIISAFNFTENKKFFAAAILISMSAFIKIFGVIAFVFFIFQKERIKAIGLAFLSM